MPVQIVIKHGNKATIPTSAAQGEPLYTQDTNELFFGTGTGTTPLKVDGANITGTIDPARIPAISESKITALTADLANKADTNDPRITTMLAKIIALG